LAADTLIIGAGVSGLSVAWRLLQRGHRVTVLERGHAGAESSWAGGGILSPLLPWDYAGPLTTLALRSMADYADWVAQIESSAEREAEFWRCGMLALAVANPQQALAWCGEHGLAAARSCPPTLRGVPAATDQTAVWLPEVAQVRNPRLLGALRTAVARLGGRILEHCAALGVVAQAGRATAVQTPTGNLPVDNVVLAAGAWSGLGLSGLPAVPNVRPIRGQMLLFKLEPGVLDTILFRNGLYLIPRRDGHVLVGSTLEDAGFDKSTDEATRRRLHAEAAELLPALASVQPILHWAGLRPGAPANIPVIDRHPDFDNVFVNAGHFRYGVTLAPASAELLAALLEGTPPPLDPAPYRWSAALQRSWEADQPHP
jgi:glycine oxidase